MHLARHLHTQRRRRSAFAALAAVALAGAVTTASAAASAPPDDTEAGGDADMADATDVARTEATGTAATEGEPSELLATARQEGITIGIANERPYGYEEDGEATGEAPAIAREVFSRLGIEEIDFEVIDFGALINGLNAGRVDVIAAGMFINAERAEQVLFADPDYCATTAFAVPEGNPDDLDDFDSVIDSGAQLGVLAGAVEEGYAIGAGVADDQISGFQTTPDLFDALDAGRVDAVALTAITVRAQVADLDGFEATEGFVPVIDGEEQLGCGAFAFRYENEDFRDEFNDVLNEMKADGEILALIEEFGFSASEVDAAADVTLESLLGGETDDSAAVDGTEMSHDSTTAGDTAASATADEMAGTTTA
ncbi:ectoine/hydroxyectoine ABC transporter substrate-binding protein EhuB [Desertimonas flava]|uniref:ectoine/hydroxyectoine ABC transporter substrate-binding protein EhuB n=1 Tax=Desertimonas flava TaxID=2064846 RepID=UPI000E341435|nr:ectoine/hydroxyectoine ABC transporter substrate-binding protein EhuB [Desertimonas flava]